jgi:hypothetical protein
MSRDVEIPKKLKYLIVTSCDVNEADSILNRMLSGGEGEDFVHKMEFLKRNFRFSMCSRFTLEEEEDRMAKEDYYATLQYLISEAKDFGIESVIRA